MEDVPIDPKDLETRFKKKTQKKTRDLEVGGAGSERRFGRRRRRVAVGIAGAVAGRVRRRRDALAAPVAVAAVAARRRRRRRTSGPPPVAFSWKMENTKQRPTLVRK